MNINRILPYVIVLLSGIFLLRGVEMINDGLPTMISRLNFTSSAKPQSDPAAVDEAAQNGGNSVGETGLSDDAAAKFKRGGASSAGSAMAASSPKQIDLSQGDSIDSVLQADADSDATTTARNAILRETPGQYRQNNSEYNHCVSLFAEKQFIPSEIDVLQELRSYQEDNQDKKNWLLAKEAALATMEKSIQSKLDKLAQQQAAMEKYLEHYGRDGPNRIEKLVRIYENMDPKEAAHIFETLQIDVLIRVAEKMKEGKLAAVLSKMKIDKAKQLTTAMASQRLQQFHFSELEE